MEPTPKQISLALPHIRYEIESFLLTPSYDKSNKALEESVYFRKMAHCRALYHFFKKKLEDRKDSKNRLDDDVLSKDFGFSSQDAYGAKSDELSKRFNKDLMHLTYDRLNRNAGTKAWPMDELFPPVANLAKKFIDHILTQYTGDLPEAERELWEKLKADVNNATALQHSASNIVDPISFSFESGK